MKEKNTLLYQITMLLLFCVLFVISMYYARGLLVPVTVAALFAMLLQPLTRRFEKWKFGRVFSILASMLIVVIIVGLIVYILSAQVISFSKDLPAIQENINERMGKLQGWVSRLTGLSVEEQMVYLKQATNSLLGVAQSFAAAVVTATTGTVVFIGLLLVLLFLFLYYRHRIKQFILMLLAEEHHEHAQKVILQISKVTQKYLTGVFTVMAILSVLNSIVFLIIGVPHAIFFGVLAAILNIIPYLGVWIGTMLPVLMVLVTSDSFTPILFIIGGVWVNQQLDNNFLTPRITGSQVAINPLATIVILIIGSILWGVAGMILFIPLLGVAKIIFDNVEGLKPLGYLIGEDQSDKPSRFARLFQRIRKKFVKKQS